MPVDVLGVPVPAFLFYLISAFFVVIVLGEAFLPVIERRYKKRKEAEAAKMD